MTPRRRRTRHRPLIVALYANAGLLALILVAVVARGGRSPLESMAFGQQVPQPIAGGGGFFLMPAQFAANVWGCYVMDVDAQTLVAYRYNPTGGTGGGGSLNLSAARSFVYDRQLKVFNTGSPTPAEVRQIVQMERDQALRPDDATTKPTIPQ